VRYHAAQREEADDLLAVEEPLQIRLAGEDVAVTMRTPGHDDELAAGFLFTEGIIEGRHHIESIAHCPPEEGTGPNIINVLPTERGLLEPGKWGRNFIASSSCGLCGKTSIEQVLRRRQTAGNGSGSGSGNGNELRAASYDKEALGAERRPRNEPLAVSEANGEAAPAAGAPWPVPPIPVHTLYSLPAKLRAAQDAFADTGGIHAAALFSPEGDLLLMREDVGRHNAVDKVIGRALLNDLLPLDHHILLVSSRASFEIVQKALVAGVALMAVISAPSTLAVDLAREGDMTLIGFLRQKRLNVYTGQWRIST
jgi:FdhD protein